MVPLIDIAVPLVLSDSGHVYGSLRQAGIARVGYRAATKQLDTSVLHGDGPNTVATQGAMGLDRRGTRLGQGKR
jgi:hypothetical protein